MTYSVKEIFYTLQGEGANAGRPAVFCRFSGCNLWSGREGDRASAQCQFCDTDFVGTTGTGGGKFPSAESLADAVARQWPGTSTGNNRFVVCTGGEPLLQLDTQLISVFHERGFEVAVETNGTIEAPPGIDWLCVSPKAGTNLQQRWGHELKLVFPQIGVDPQEYEELHFEKFFLQPMDGPKQGENTTQAIRYCLARPVWRLSVQSHKTLGIR